MTNFIKDACADDLEKALRDYAAKFQVLADPLRLKILLLLREGEKCVCELVDAIQEKQPLVSYHLKLMTDAGLVLKRKEGTWAYYKLSMDVQQWVINCCQDISSDDIIASVKKQIACKCL